MPIIAFAILAAVIEVVAGSGNISASIEDQRFGQSLGSESRVQIIAEFLIRIVGGFVFVGFGWWFGDNDRFKCRIWRGLEIFCYFLGFILLFNPSGLLITDVFFGKE